MSLLFNWYWVLSIISMNSTLLIYANATWYIIYICFNFIVLLYSLDRKAETIPLFCVKLIQMDFEITVRKWKKKKLNCTFSYNVSRLCNFGLHILFVQFWFPKYHSCAIWSLMFQLRDFSPRYHNFIVLVSYVSQ